MQSNLVKEVIAIAGMTSLLATWFHERSSRLNPATYIPVLEDLDIIIAHLDVIVRFDSHASVSRGRPY